MIESQPQSEFEDEDMLVIEHHFAIVPEWVIDQRSSQHRIPRQAWSSMSAPTPRRHLGPGWPGP